MRGHVRKRRTWEFIVDIGRHPVTGRRCQKSKSSFATRGDAERALREFIEFTEGGNPFPERTVLADQLSRWLEYERARGIRPRTLNAYEGYIRRDILPVIGDLEIEKIRPGHVRAVLTRMPLRGLAESTVTQVRGILSSALRQAMEDGRIATNPVASVKRPKTPREEVHWPEPAQVAALLKASRGSIWEPAILLAATTGARRSEVLGIFWEDVDLREGTIFISRGVQAKPSSDGQETIAFSAVKTKRSRRLVQLPPFALERIRRHRREQLKRRARLGPRWHDPLDEFGRPVSVVCDRGDGLPPYPDSFTSAFKRFARQAGMHPATRLHDLRHAVATELGRQGVHPVIVSAVLGHASQAFTVAVYQHAWQEGRAEAAVAMEAALAPPSKTLAIGWHGKESNRPAGGRPFAKPQVRGVGRGGFEPPTNGL
jgi:integrase